MFLIHAPGYHDGKPCCDLRPAEGGHVTKPSDTPLSRLLSHFVIHRIPSIRPFSIDFPESAYSTIHRLSIPQMRPLIHLCSHPSIRPFDCPSACLSIYLPVYPSVCSPGRLAVRLSASVCVSLSLSVCLSVSVCFSQFLCIFLSFLDAFCFPVT